MDQASRPVMLLGALSLGLGILGKLSTAAPVLIPVGAAMVGLGLITHLVAKHIGGTQKELDQKQDETNLYKQENFIKEC